MFALVRRNPAKALAAEPVYRPLSLIEEVEALTREMWDSWPRVAFDTSLTPRLDMYEEKDELVIRAEFPGLKKKDIDISLQDDTLTIKAEKKQEKTTEEATHYTSERSFGLYSRSIALPAHVDAESVSATFKNGLLEVKLPKAEQPETKHIDIKVR